MKNIHKHTLSYILLLVMVGAAVLFNDREIILPEMAALTVGSLIYRHPLWVSKPHLLFILPSLTAIAGFGINFLPLAVENKLIAIIALTILLLRLFRSTLVPALATGLLPILTNSTSYGFLISIILLSLVLSLGILLSNRYEPSQNIPTAKHKIKDNAFYFIFISFWIVLCSQSGYLIIAAIPPVLVVSLESVHKKTYPLKVMFKQITCLFLASAIGGLSLYYIQDILLVAILDIALVTLLLKAMNFKLAPAYAMAFLPMVLHQVNLTSFHWQVLLMCLLILPCVYLYKAKVFKQLIVIKNSLKQ